jgi:predicted secreted hydrolase
MPIALLEKALFLLMAVSLAAAPAPAAYRSVTGPCDFLFPDDHGAHPEYRTEWWYWTGNVAAEDGGRYGFQLTFFRTRIRPPGEGSPPGGVVSAWRTPQIFLAHAAVSDLERGRHISAQRTARGALGLSGARAEDGKVTVFLFDWAGRIGPDAHRLTARAQDVSLELTLLPEKPPVAHGEGGYSRKGDAPEMASCYYSVTRLAAGGTLRVGERVETVSGSAWMDHEYSTAPLDPELEGWDWFSLQLSDGADLMLYLLREKDGGLHPASSGTWVDPAGRGRHLERDSFAVSVEERWESPRTGAVYPSLWRVSVPSEGLVLTVRPRLADQEMHTSESTGVVYWEGSVGASGTRQGRPLKGEGYVELTGYASPFDAPL